MEVIVKFKACCQSPSSAKAMSELFQNISKGIAEGDLVLCLEAGNRDSDVIDSIKELIENHADNLRGLESYEIDDRAFCSSFTSGGDVEDFLFRLARFSKAYKVSDLMLTGKFDEGIYVCDLIDGVPHVEEFEDYEAYEALGFSNTKDNSVLSITGVLPEEFLGKWELDFKKVYELKFDKLEKLWETLPKDKKEKYSSLENYIRMQIENESKSESETLIISESAIESIRKLYGDVIREKVAYSLKKFDQGVAFVTEYIEEMGDIEEFFIEMSLFEGGKYLKIQQEISKRIFVYRKI